MKSIKNRVVTVRITESQLENLRTALYLEKLSQSEFIRECIEVYGNSYRKHLEKINSPSKSKSSVFNSKNQRNASL